MIPRHYLFCIHGEEQPTVSFHSRRQAARGGFAIGEEEGIYSQQEQVCCLPSYFLPCFWWGIKARAQLRPILAGVLFAGNFFIYIVFLKREWLKCL